MTLRHLPPSGWVARIVTGAGRSLAVVACLSGLSGCGPGADPSAGDGAPQATLAPGGARSSQLPQTPAGVTLPQPGGVFDYQIGGAYAPAPDAAIIDRDRTAEPDPGRYSICYINAFQTQPGEASLWPDPALLRGPDGQLVRDPDWPDEYLLDTRSALARQTIMAMLGPWLGDCARKGFRAVEPDNLDSWTRSGGALTSGGNAALAEQIAAAAHKLGLAVAQKNAADLAGIGKTRIGFDFAIAEECHVYDECRSYTDAYGPRVIEIEYPDTGGLANFRAACAALGQEISVIYRDRRVIPAGQPGYTYQHC